MAGTLVAYPVPSEPAQKPPSPVRIPGGHTRSVFSISFAVRAAPEPQCELAEPSIARDGEAVAAGEAELPGSPASRQSDESPVGRREGDEAAAGSQLGRRGALQVRAVGSESDFDEYLRF